MFSQGRLENGACVGITVAAGFIELGDVSAQQRLLGIGGELAFHGNDDGGPKPLANCLGRKISLIGRIAASGGCRNAEHRAEQLQHRHRSLRKHRRLPTDNDHAETAGKWQGPYWLRRPGGPRPSPFPPPTLPATLGPPPSLP